MPGVESVTVDLNTAFYVEEGALNESFELTVDAAGTVNGEYVLPEDVPLGSYQLIARGGDYQSTRFFTVADYRKPEFLITMEPSQDQALRGETVNVEMEVTYFAGGSVPDAPVSWSIYQEPYYPNVPGPYYAFGDLANIFYWEPNSFSGGYLTGGEGQTDENGRFTISVTPDMLKDLEEGSHTINVEASVSDLGNFPITSRTSFVLHPSTSYVGIAPEGYVAQAGAEADVNLFTIDWDGQAKPDQDVEVVIYFREWESSRVADYGPYRTVWTPVDSEMERIQARSDDQGKAVVRFTPERGGSYVIEATVTDSGGRSQTSSTTLWVTDSRFVGWRDDGRERIMTLAPDKQEYQPGETAQILVQSPFEGPVEAWLTIERGSLFDQQVITLESSSDLIDIRIPPEFAPNVHVSITAVKPVRPNDEYPYADIRLGITELVVTTDELGLNVELAPQSEVFEPGSTAVYDIHVTDHQGDPVQADLSLALVDLAVLSLKEDNAPHIRDAFYALQPLRSNTGGSLFISGEGIEPEVPIEILGRGGGGGGDLAQEAGKALSEEGQDDVRKNFRDTAYWRANLETGGDGRATVEIPLPDNLTTWRLHSKASTSNSLVGQNEVDVLATLPLLLRPVTPRFFTVGDVMQIGTYVNNNTGTAIEAVVSLEADGLTISSEYEQAVTVPAHDRVLVTWPILVDDVPLADLIFRVEGGGYSDATKPTFGFGPDQTIPVFRYTGEDIVGTAGEMDEVNRRVEALLLPTGVDTRQGSVNIKLNASLGAAMLESLEAVNWNLSPVSCAHNIADRLLPNAATMQTIRELNLDEPGLETELDELILRDITILEELALPGGGWGWCYSDEQDPWLTAHALLTLLTARDAGYTVPMGTMVDAGQYLADTLEEPAEMTEPYAINRQLFFLYVLGQMGDNLPEYLDSHFSEHRNLMSPYGTAFLAMAYANANLAPENVATLLADLSDSAVVSATGAHWEDADPDRWHNLSSDVRDTAVVLKALANLDTDNVFGPSAVRWLMTARTAPHWSTSHETAWSILALTDYMAATGELDANYEYALAVNMEPVTGGRFSRDNVLDTVPLSVPISELALGETNFFDFQRGDGDGRFYYTMHLDSFITADNLPAVDRGFSIERTYYDAACDPEVDECQPIDSIEAGQQVRVELNIVVPHDRVYVVIEDPLPAGAEGIDPNLDTTGAGFNPGVNRGDDSYKYWGWWYFNRVEFRDEKVAFYAPFLPAGSYQYTYYLQTNIPGEYQVMPTVAKEEFFPEVFGRADGMIFNIEP